MLLAARSRTIAGALAVVAVAAPTALARANTDPHQRLYVNPSTGYATPVPTAHRDASGADQNPFVNPFSRIAYPKQGSQTTADMGSPQPPVEAPSSGGFDWPSAAIGAAAAGGLLLVLLTAAIGVGKSARAGRSPRRAGG